MMTAIEQRATNFFVAQSLEHARDLSPRDAELFLKGLLIIGGEHEAVAPLVAAHDDIRAHNLSMTQLQRTLDLR